MKVTIYGSEQCGYCTQAKQLCDEKNLEYEYHSVPDDPKLLEWFRDCGFRTVPQVFLHKDGYMSHIGGYEELRSQFE